MPIGLGLVVGQPIGLFIFAFYEGYRALEQRRDIRAGLWFGVLLLKPQLVAPLILVFLLKRRWRALGGVCGTASVIGATSLAVLGVSGCFALLRTIAGYASGVAATQYRMAPQEMISWRGPWSVERPRLARRVLATTIVAILVGFDVHPHGAVLLIVPILAISACRQSSWAPRFYVWVGLCGVTILTFPYSYLTGYPMEVAMAHVFAIFMLVSIAVISAGERRDDLASCAAVAPAL